MPQNAIRVFSDKFGGYQLLDIWTDSGTQQWYHQCTNTAIDCSRVAGYTNNACRELGRVEKVAKTAIALLRERSSNSFK